MKEKQLSQQKTARNPIPIIPIEKLLPKPKWIRAKAPFNDRYTEIKSMLRELKLHSVCEEATCPNIGECFGRGTATFMILGDMCTRRCPFCDIGHGRPDKPDPSEPENLAAAIARLNLNYVVITSVDRDDLRDGGATHFAECIQAIRLSSISTKVEVLVPDFRRRQSVALDCIDKATPDVFNHNLETVPRMYLEARPGASYVESLSLLQQFKQRHPELPTKSGIMVGLGETDEEIFAVMRDMRSHDVNMLTIGQYLQPSRYHLPVKRYVEPARFDDYAVYAREIGFKMVASGPLVRSSYEADRQAHLSQLVS